MAPAAWCFQHKGSTILLADRLPERAISGAVFKISTVLPLQQRGHVKHGFVNLSASCCFEVMFWIRSGRHLSYSCSRYIVVVVLVVISFPHCSGSQFMVHVADMAGLFGIGPSQGKRLIQDLDLTRTSQTITRT